MQTGKRHTEKPFYVWLAFLTNSILIGAWSSRIPEFKTYFQTENGLWGMVLLTIPLFSLVASFPTSRFIRRFSLTTTLRLASLLSLGTFALIPHTKQVELFVGILVLYGFSSGMLNLAMNAAAGAYEHQTGAPIMAASHGMYSFGGMLGAGLGVLAGSLLWSRTFFFGVLATALLLFNLYLFTVKIPDNSTGTSSLPPKGISGYLLLLAVTSFIYMAIEGMILNWSALFLKTETATPLSLLSLGFLAFSATMTLGRWSGNRFFTRFSVRQVMVGGSTLVMGGFLLLWLVYQYIPAILAFALVGAGASALVPLLFSEATKFVQPTPETAIAVILSAGISGIMMGSPVIGFASEVVGLRNAMLIPFFMSGSILLLHRFFPHQNSDNQTNSQTD
ncbi:MAG: MFS transporter [Bacteroidetes Order II. Incertae sedis bacterium]|nr:MFS transporter [Bacteroidetes Order II. bacterium]